MTITTAQILAAQKESANTATDDHEDNGRLRLDELGIFRNAYSQGWHEAIAYARTHGYCGDVAHKA